MVLEDEFKSSAGDAICVNNVNVRPAEIILKNSTIT